MKQKNKMLKKRGISEIWMPYVLVIVVLVFVYQVSYLSYPGVPGNNEQWPQGWWEWVDQGLYRKSSAALVVGNLSASEHFYMPLYPFLGSLLMGVTPLHSYWLPNLLLLLGFAILFMMLVSRYIGTWLAAGTIIVSMALFEPLRLQWVIPWTSTLSAFLMMAAIFLLDQFFRMREQLGLSVRNAVINAMFFGGALGALAATRMVDFAVMAPVGLAYAFLLAHDLIRKPEKRRVLLIMGFSGMSGFLLFILILFAFNYTVYGAIVGGSYISAAQHIGFFPSTLVVKLYSQIINSYSLYGDAGQDWLSNIKIFAVSIAFLPALLVAPVRLIFKIIAMCAIIQMGIYYSYSDIVPSGTFRYYNIHYFKWLMPFLIVGMLLIIRGVWQHSCERRSYINAVIIVVVIIVIAFGIDLVKKPVSLKLVEQSDHKAIFSIAGKELDFIDIRATSDSWETIYFAKGFSVMLDGKPLLVPRDYRPHPITDGLRLLFVRPVSGDQLVLAVGNEVRLTKQIDDGNVVAGRVFFRPKWSSLAHQINTVIVGETLTFSAGGSAGRFLDKGWSVGEPWGRWVDGNEAGLSLQFLDESEDDLFITITAGGFVADKHPRSLTEVVVNNCIVARLHFNKINASPKDHLMRVPRNCIDDNGRAHVVFRNIFPISPKEVGVSDDPRRLGVGVHSLRFHY